MTTSILTAVQAWFAAKMARMMRPGYMPRLCAPEGEQAAADLHEAYKQAVTSGYLHARQLMKNGPRLTGKKRMKKGAIAGNVNVVTDRFKKCAETLDPDGLAAELVRLFCIGVSHMDNLDNQRRVVSVWSAILTPAVVLREKEGRPIEEEDLVVMACQWLRQGFTSQAKEIYASRDTRFAAGHPARIYELIADTAKQHDLEHLRLISCVIDPVAFGVGQHIGARQAAAGVIVPELEAFIDDLKAA